MHEQNMAILKSLVAVAWADGKVAEEEREVIEALLQAFDASEAESLFIKNYASEPKSLDDIPLTDMSADDRRVLLQHAVFLTYIDGHQDEKERDLLVALSTQLRIPDEERTQIVNLATDRAKRFLNILLATRGESRGRRGSAGEEPRSGWHSSRVTCYESLALILCLASACVMSGAALPVVWGGA